MAPPFSTQASRAYGHTTVLLEEAVDALVTSDSGHYIDGTFGRGGHSRAVLERLAASGRLTAFDKDPEAVAAAQALAATHVTAPGRLAIRHEGFGQMQALAHERGLGWVDGILLDLGVSSAQIDDPSRGFSFRGDGPLDMRMDCTRGPSVHDWLQTAPVRQIEEVIREYGEERFAVSIAKAIGDRRQAGRLPATTLELADLVAGAVKTREPGQNPATRTFQAFRIFINAELEELQQALNASLGLLKAGGRLVVISFHSLEDRMVKRFIQQHSREAVDRRSPAWMLGGGAEPLLKALGRVKPGADEVAANPRARSAVMRVAERSAAPLPTDWQAQPGGSA